MNLLEETEEILKNNNKTLLDIEWFGCRGFEVPISKLIDLLDVKYDSGFGSPEVVTDLVLVGKDFWLERHEYDGSEWWEYKSIPKRPLVKFSVDKLVGDLWPTLEDLKK